MTAMTVQSFADDVLAAVGIDPATHPHTEQVVQAWEGSEGGNWHNTATANPLNTTLPYNGSHVLSGGGAAAKAGVQAYSSWTDGIAATVSTLEHTSGHPYNAILDAAAADNGPALAQAIVNSPWGTTAIDYGGQRYSKGAGTSTPSSSSSSSSSGGSGATNAAFPGGNWDPLNWPGQILDAGVSSVWDQVQPFLLQSVFTVGAIALFVIGAKQLVQPTIDKTKNQAEQLAPLAAAAA